MSLKDTLLGCTLVLALLFLFVAQKADSETLNIGLLIEAMENREADEFLNLIQSDPDAVFEQDENGFTILDYSLVSVDEDQKLYSYPEIFKISWLVAHFPDPEIKERLISRGLFALGALDNEKTKIELTDDMRSGIHRSELIELIVFMVDRSSESSALSSGDLPVQFIIQTCDKGAFQKGDLEHVASDSLANIYGKVPSIRRQFFQTYVATSILDADCVGAFETR